MQPAPSMKFLSMLSFASFSNIALQCFSMALGKELASKTCKRMLFLVDGLKRHPGKPGSTCTVQGFLRDGKYWVIENCGLHASQRQSLLMDDHRVDMVRHIFWGNL